MIKELSRGNNFTPCQAAENGRDDVIRGRIIFLLQPRSILLLIDITPQSVLFSNCDSGGKGEILLNIQFNFHIFLTRELYDEKSIARLSLSERGIHAHDKEHVHIIWFREEEEFDDLIIGNFVIVSFPAETEERVIHVDIISTAGCGEELRGEGDNGVAGYFAQ